MFAFRLRQARLAAGLTLDALAAQLTSSGRPLSKAALSKFENNQARPTAANLLAISAALGVTADWLLSEPAMHVEWFAFRKHAALSKAGQERSQAAAWMAAERHLWLEHALNASANPGFPVRRHVSGGDDTEAAAEALREYWELGSGPIESLTQAAEDHGAIVVELADMDDKFHGVSGMANDRYPVVVVAARSPTDRKRFSVGHEIGHIVLDCSHLTEREEESLANRFAGALLMPAQSVRAELGPRRASLDVRELACLKAKYGISMSALVRRALDVGVIGQSVYKQLVIELNRRGWRKAEPVECRNSEAPLRAKLLALRAMAEGLITPSRAEELCPGSTAELPTAAPRMTARELLGMPEAARDNALREAARNAADEYAVGMELREFGAVDAPIEVTP